MIWNKIAWGYDAFETLLNREVYTNTGKLVAEEIEPDDIVLECACGTGSISRHIAPACKKLVACDMSEKMMDQARRNCAAYDNVRFFKADITRLDVGEGRFDKVVAGNVIHLLDDPVAALKGFERVCKTGGKIIIPTYIDVKLAKHDSIQNRLICGFVDVLGIEFKRGFDPDSYKQFFKNAGYENVTYKTAEGRCPCMIAVIQL